MSVMGDALSSRPGFREAAEAVFETLQRPLLPVMLFVSAPGCFPLNHGDLF